MLANSMARIEPPLVRFCTTRGGSSGCDTRSSSQAKQASRIAPTTRKPMVKGLLQAVVSACEKP